MQKDKILINIFGPSGAGKSTLTSLLQGSIERLYTVDFDIVKRQLTGYNWQRDRETAKILTLDTLSSAAGQGLPILLLFPPPKDEKEYLQIKAVAQKYDHKLINVEITAPEEILIERLTDRLEQIKASGTAQIFKTIDQYRETIRAGYYTPADHLTFDSSTLSPEDIFHALQNKISSTYEPTAS